MKRHTTNGDGFKPPSVRRARNRTNIGYRSSSTPGCGRPLVCTAAFIVVGRRRETVRDCRSVRSGLCWSRSRSTGYRAWCRCEPLHPAAEQLAKSVSELFLMCPWCDDPAYDAAHPGHHQFVKRHEAATPMSGSTPANPTTSRVSKPRFWYATWPRLLPRRSFATCSGLRRRPPPVTVMSGPALRQRRSGLGRRRCAVVWLAVLTAVKSRDAMGDLRVVLGHPLDVYRS